MGVTKKLCRRLLVRLQGRVLRVRLNRPEVHNALDGELIEDLAACCSAVEAGGEVRAVLLSGEGPSFCAGADLNWMREAAGWSAEENRRDAQRLAAMLAALNDLPVPSVARIHGGALGGGAGLLACCDVVVAADTTRFSFAEVKLGLLPAVISPFVVAKIGESHARALFATGERFDAQRALRIGLVHHVIPEATLDAAVERVLAELLTSAPAAAAEARRLIREVQGRSPADVRDYTAETIARLRASDEGREGIAAFLEKRKPRWVNT
ncbi:MAG: enoyl-CoA hydratase-related protein [Chloroflexota bacterium]